MNELPACFYTYPAEDVALVTGLAKPGARYEALESILDNSASRLRAAGYRLDLWRRG